MMLSGLNHNEEQVPCEHTLKASVKTTVKVSILSSITTIVLLILFSFFVVIPFVKKRIFETMKNPKYYLGMVAVYDLTKKKAAYHMMLEEIKEIEKGVHKARARHDAKLSPWRKITNKEREDYSVALYISAVTEGNDWRGFVANTIAETKFDKGCVSWVGAKGLNQLMPDTFKKMNREMAKFGHYDIYNVWHNTRAGLKYWVMARNYMRWYLGREPSVGEVAMGYNGGFVKVARAIKHKKIQERLGNETIEHGKIVQFYYDNICKGVYDSYYVAK